MRGRDDDLRLVLQVGRQQPQRNVRLYPTVECDAIYDVWTKLGHQYDNEPKRSSKSMTE